MRIKLKSGNIIQVDAHVSSVNVDLKSSERESCLYVEVGCSFKGNNLDLQAHYGQQKNLHLQLALKSAHLQKEETKKVKNDLENLREKNHALMKHVSSLTKRSEDIVHAEIKELEELLRKCELRVDDKEERIKYLEGELKIKESQFSNSSILNAALSQEKTKLKRRVQDLEDELKRTDKAYMNLELRLLEENQKMKTQNGIIVFELNAFMHKHVSEMQDATKSCSAMQYNLCKKEQEVLMLRKENARQALTAVSKDETLSDLNQKNAKLMSELANVRNALSCCKVMP